jgi:hypothetical protein
MFVFTPLLRSPTQTQVPEFNCLAKREREKKISLAKSDGTAPQGVPAQ